MAFFAFLAALCLAVVVHETAAIIQVLVFGHRRTLLERVGAVLSDYGRRG